MVEKENKLTQLNIIGTIHSTSKSKSRIKDAINNNNYDLVLVEGMTTRKTNYSFWLKDFYLMLIIFIYSFILINRGSEFLLAEKLSKEKNIELKNIDLDFNLVFLKFHKWYNNIIVPLITVFIFMLMTYFFRIATIFSFIICFIIASFIYLLYFALKTKKIRDLSFINKTKQFLQEGKYSNVLVIIGKAHRSVFKKNFKDNNSILLKTI